MMLATVTSVRGKKQAELEADPSFVYVGRAVKWTRWPDSLWGNPYSVARFGGDALNHYIKAVEFARRWGAASGRPITGWQTEKLPWCHAVRPDVLERFREGMASLEGLRGKVLGCWCGEWTPGEPEIGCHAVVLAKLVNSMEVVPCSR